ncbi:MAG: hypothetical protein M3Y72_03510 [Acidobacteriota bacterium]|nr:hypothetical protein [Acidobacteriota bacterium]
MLRTFGTFCLAEGFVRLWNERGNRPPLRFQADMGVVLQRYGLATVSFGVGALMALTKSKKHFIGLTWDDAGHKGGIAFQADKSDYRGLLAGLEGITGKKAVSSEPMTVRN